MKVLTVTAASLALAGFAFAGSTAMPTAAEAATKACEGPKVSWRFSFWGKRRAFTEGMEHVTKHVSDQTCGNFKINIYYGEQLSKSKENLDSISVGAIDGASFCASYHPGKNRPLNVLDLPFLPVADFDTLRKVHDAIYRHPASAKALDKWNAVIYMSNILPQYEYMGRGEPPKSVADFKGKRLRALGGMGAAARAIGAVPTTMPASETYTALQRGTVDAIGFPFTYSFASYRLDEVADWYTTNMSLGTVTCPTVFNKNAYNKLPAEYKTILDEAIPGAYDAMKEAYASVDKVNLANWGKSKMTAVTIPETEMAEFRRIGGKPIWEAWVKDNQDKIPAQELLDLVLKTAQQ